MTSPVLVVGAGPAGCSCALWLKRLDVPALLVEAADAVGGLQRGSDWPNDEIACVPTRPGSEVARAMAAQMATADVPLRLGTRVLSVAAEPGGGFAAQLERSSGAERLLASAVVAASGVRPADGGLSPGAAVHIGPLARADLPAYRGLHVAILGGGDNAFELHPALRAAGAASATIFARTLRARPSMLARVPTGDVVLGQTDIDAAAMRVGGRPFDRIVVLYGFAAHAPYLDALDVSRDARGMIAADVVTRETAIPGLFAIGELTARLHPCVVTAMADGVQAAVAIAGRRHERARRDYGARLSRS